MSRLVVLVGLVMALAVALPGSTEATSRHQVKKLLASDAEAADIFGWSVAVSGDTAVVGAGGEFAGSEPGAAYVFQRDQGGTDNWGEVTKLTASDAQAGDWFGTSVAVTGDIVVVGARLEDAGGSDAGAAYVFQRNQGGADNWGEVTKLTASDTQAGDYFGVTVAVSSDTVVIGAVREDAGGDDAGAAYVFQRDQGGTDNWGELTKITASDAQADDFFGFAVAVGNETIMVGAIFQDAGGTDAGAAYVFQRDEGGQDNWGELTKLTASDAEAGDRFGVSVAVGGDTTVVGAPLEDAAGGSAGAAYVFQRDQGGADTWGEVAKLTASDAEIFDSFGQSVGVSGDTAIVGARHDGEGGFNAGAAYFFERDQGGADTWGEVAKLTASDAQAGNLFGYGVAISGDTAVVGASSKFSGFEPGAAYVFDLAQPKPTPADTPTATITPTLTITPTSTITPTPMATIPPGVGGVALDSDLRALPLETADPASAPWGVTLAIVAVVSLAAVGGAAWYARRRWLT